MTVQIASITGDPTPEEVVAITVAVTALVEQAPAPVVAAAAAATPPDWLSVWVVASRRSAQRSQLTRGPWRISGRLARRSRI
jgi:hypothetical protein